MELESDIIQCISAHQAWHYRLVPLKSSDSEIHCLVDESNLPPHLEEELEIILGRKVILEKTESNSISQLLNRYYRRGQNGQIIGSSTLSGSWATDFLDNLLHEAQALGSSDIHIESYDETRRIRMRLDGHLIEKYTLEKEVYQSLVNKVKIKSSLDIAEKRLPQDGRVSHGSGIDKIDLRVSVLPTLHGEKVVIRLLSHDASRLDLDNLGFQPPQLAQYKNAIQKPHGIILISGPTGSGKTTTLYATLKVLNSKERNIMTVEDPVEYSLEGINQVHVRENIGLTFASALRSFLRQDPDIIMLGEIRDIETANMAIRAALTGHLVLSTIHTNSAWGTVNRLVDMGVPSYLLASTLNCTLAQRLVRKLCPRCSEHDSSKGGKCDNPVKKAVGCEHCHYTGYSGRVPLYEVIPVDGIIASHIRDNSPDINDYIQKNNYSTLHSVADRLLKSGVTSLEEVQPILSSR